jgi:FkbH-like protein
MSNSALYTRLAWLPKPPQDFSAQCSALQRSGENLGARLRALGSCALDQNQLERLAGIIGQAQAAGADLQPLLPFRLSVLSNSTVDFLIPAMVATAARFGIALQVTTGGFGQVLQEALSPESAVNRFAPDAVLIALDYRGLPLTPAPGSESAEQSSVQAALDQLALIRKGIQENSKAICIVQTLAPPPETLFGSLDARLPGTLARIVQEINARIAQDLNGTPDVLLDVAQLAATVGSAEWHCPRDWNLGKFPFSDVFVPLYAEHACRVIAALRGKSRRCLILDLDNTVWGGVIGDDGLDGIQLAQGDATGEAFLAVQRMALELRSRGIALAVCSKNEDQTARLPFRSHPEMLLRENHIAVFQANWQDKPSNIRAIADALSLGTESMVFLDDNPVEREFVRKSLPEVAVPELPDDPAFYARTLNAAGYFEAVAFSREDVDRAEFYQDNARRVQLQQQAGDLEGYLRSLQMEITFQSFDSTGRARIAQLVNKSNQFNLTTRRYTEGQIAEWEHDPGAFTLQIRLRDIFGDNGMISVVICRESVPGQWEIDTWLMSCRVLGRKVEQAVLGHLLEHARQRGIRRLLGTYIATSRNSLVVEHYAQLGFTQLEGTESGTKHYSLDVASTTIPEVPMKKCCFCLQPSGQGSARVSDLAEGCAESVSRMN